MNASTKNSETERLILEYAKKAKKSKKIVRLSEAIEDMRLDPREAVNGAKRLEEQGLLKPKRLM